MTVAKWTAGTTYAPGTLVQPASSAGSTLATITNADFESGDTGWGKGTGWAITNTAGAFAGSWRARFTGTGIQFLTSDTKANVAPGTVVTATARGKITANNDHLNLRLQWYDASDAELTPTTGDALEALGGYREFTVTGTAPAGAATVAVFVRAFSAAGSPMDVDQIAWDLVTQDAPSEFVFQATQAADGVSGTDEPTWPTTLAGTVTDGTVTWTAVATNRVTWTATPLLESGSVEPTWPTSPGVEIVDNTIAWECISRRVEDENCPNSTAVVILASKVFAVDDDIVRFSATINPLDWTTAEDAGYLPTGQQQANGNAMVVLGQYRGNLVALNASSFQNWSVDPDPSLMALLDQMDGIGSTWPEAAQAVGDDWLYLSQLGVRSISIAAGAQNLTAGEVGQPIDVLVQPAMAAARASSTRVASTYYPGAGQYWLSFADYPTTGSSTAFVLALRGPGKGAWSRYVFPYAVEAFAQLDDDLYIRAGDAIYRVDESATDDDGVDFAGLVQWPWLDFGQPGVTKMLEGFDYVGEGQAPSVRFGYDQRTVASLTPAYAISADTLPGTMIPYGVTAPSFSLRLDFAGGAAWRVLGAALYVHDDRAGT